MTPPACAFANWFTGRDMTMETLMDDLRTQVDAPRTKIRVVTAILGSTSPVSTLISLMPEVTCVASVVFSEKCASPALVSSNRSPDHVYLSLPVANTAPLCLRHARRCPHTPNKAALCPGHAGDGPDLPHVLMCDNAALDTKLPNIAARLFAVL